MFAEICPKRYPPFFPFPIPHPSFACPSLPLNADRCRIILIPSFPLFLYRVFIVRNLRPLFERNLGFLSSWSANAGPSWAQGSQTLRGLIFLVCLTSREGFFFTPHLHVNIFLFLSFFCECHNAGGGFLIKPHLLFLPHHSFFYLLVGYQ